MHRLRVSNFDTSRIAVKAASSPIGDAADLKEGLVHRIEVGEDSFLTEDDEVFEWGEVVRGRLPSVLSYWMLSFASGLKDIQTWLTGIAYASLIVSLYSYSLFLYVQTNEFSVPVSTYARTGLPLLQDLDFRADKLSYTQARVLSSDLMPRI